MASLLTITATAHPFADVPEWAREYVDEVYEFGIMNGTSDDTFASDMPLTREQLVVTLYRMSGAGVVSSDYFLKSKFSDYADISVWARDAVQWAYREGITAGIKENGVILFKPQKEVSRQEAAKLLVTFIESFDLYAKYDSTAHINDLASVASWALSYVEKCISAGIINGDGNGNFKPEAG
ncbi:MAG: S-layer homology domain-containing protein, partial [Clostridia bacterium]|nr:S-layer homology domain-containing protein [Clostridia bacterium]